MCAHREAVGGEEGMEHVLRAMCGDLMMNIHLAGLRGLDEVNRDILVRKRNCINHVGGYNRNCAYASAICSPFMLTLG